MMTTKRPAGGSVRDDRHKVAEAREWLRRLLPLRAGEYVTVEVAGHKAWLALWDVPGGWRAVTGTPVSTAALPSGQAGREVLREAGL
jgi:hypothetical protein